MSSIIAYPEADLAPRVTDLALQATAFAVVGELTRRAGAAGVPQLVLPVWTVAPGFATGHLLSDDTTALAALEAWRNVFGLHRIGGRLCHGPLGVRWASTIATTIADVSVRLTASVPAAAAPRREAAAA